MSLVPKIGWPGHHTRSRRPEMTHAILHHWRGNRTLISNISFSSSAGFFFFFFFRCSLKSASSKLSGSPSWISLWSGYDGRVSAFTIWRTATPNVCAQSLIFCMFCGAIGIGDNICIPVWPTGSWHFRVQDTKTLDLQNNRPPTGLSPLSLLWLHFQGFLRNLTPCKVDIW